MSMKDGIYVLSLATGINKIHHNNLI